MRKIIITLLTALLLASSFSADAAPGGSGPEDTVALFQQAIDAMNPDIADAHLDFDSIVGAFVTETLPQINQAAAQGLLHLPSPLDLVLASLNSGNLATQKAAIALLSAELRKFTLYGVASGAFAGKPVSPEKVKDLDGGLFLRFGSISPYRKVFSQAELKEQSGDSALVSTWLTDYGTGGKYYLEVLMEKKGDVWKAVKLANAADFFTVIMNEAAGQ